MKKFNIGFIGMGLIGGSMSLDLKANDFADQCFGLDSGRASQKKALELGLVDELVNEDSLIQKSDIIIVAVPVDNTVAILPDILSKIGNDKILIEVGSTKSPIEESVKGHPNRRRFVSTHPMAGTEFSGPEAAIRDLFKGKRGVICDKQDSDSDAVEIIESLYRDGLKMQLIYMNSKEHDVHTAYISHISHICSFALANTVLEKEKDEKRIFELASTGFESTVRLAKSSPETWIQIFHQNQENLLDVLDEYINTLLKYKGLLLSESYSKLKDELAKANDIKRILK
ncbi:MAG: hypothetical protein RIR51_1072 [Bacteroidota bacterium]